jgi:hypothetical protein
MMNSPWLVSGISTSSSTSARAAAIGRHHRHFVLFEADENAVENVARFVVEMAKEVLRNMPLNFSCGSDIFLSSFKT